MKIAPCFWKCSLSMLCAFSLVGVSRAQITANGKSYLFRARYVAGSVMNFMSTSTIEGADKSVASIVAKVPITIKVLKVVGGVATVSLHMPAMTVSGNKVPEVNTEFPLDNRNRSKNGSAAQAALPFPQKPVSPGSTWKAQIPMNLQGSPTLMTGVYTFQGVSTIAGHRVGVIAYRLEGTAEGSGTMMVLTRDGTLFSNEYRLRVEGANRLFMVHSKVVRV